MWELDKINENTVQLDSIQIDMRSIGCMHSADELLTAWKELQAKGLPLNEIAELFVKLETKFPSSLSLSLPSQIVRLVDFLYYGKKIKGMDKRVNSLRKNLCTQILGVIRGRKKQEDAINSILEEIVQNNDEFQVAVELHKAHPSLEFVEEKSSAADYRVRELNVRIEAKSTLSRHVENLYSLIHSVPSKVIDSLLSMEAINSGKLEKAFEKQNADIVIVNLSHSDYGPLFARNEYQFGGSNKRTIQYALEDAIKMVREGKKPVILYSEAAGMTGTYELFALALDKVVVERKGAELRSRIKTKGYTTTKHYFEIVDEAWHP